MHCGHDWQHVKHGTVFCGHLDHGHDGHHTMVIVGILILMGTVNIVCTMVIMGSDGHKGNHGHSGHLVLCGHCGHHAHHVHHEHWSSVSIVFIVGTLLIMHIVG